MSTRPPRDNKPKKEWTEEEKAEFQKRRKEREE